MINKDFYDNLPGEVCVQLDYLVNNFSEEKWFEEAWNKYRDHVLNSDMDSVRMPGFIFNEYLNQDITHSIYSNDYCIIDYDNIICHYDANNQKWGEQKYQNGNALVNNYRIRYNKSANDYSEYVNNITKELEHANKTTNSGAWDESKHPRDKDGKFISTGKVADTYEKTSKDTSKYVYVDPKTLDASGKILSETRSIVRESSNILPNEKGRYIHGDYRDISNEDMQKVINRLQLEQRYAELTGDNKYIKSGSEKAREVLQTVGSTLGIALSGLTIYKIITSDIIKPKKTVV